MRSLHRNSKNRAPIEPRAPPGHGRRHTRKAHTVGMDAERQHVGRLHIHGPRHKNRMDGPRHKHDPPRAKHLIPDRPKKLTGRNSHHKADNAKAPERRRAAGKNGRRKATKHRTRHVRRLATKRTSNPREPSPRKRGKVTWPTESDQQPYTSKSSKTTTSGTGSSTQKTDDQWEEAPSATRDESTH